MSLSLRQRLTDFMTIMLMSVISGCVETTEMAGRDGYRPPRSVVGDAGFDQTQAAMFGAWAQSPATMKIIVMALALALLVSVIIGTTLYYKAENHKD